MRTKVDRGGRGFSCKWSSYSVWSLEERRGHLNVLSSSSSCVKDWKIKKQTRNKYCMHVFFKEFLFLYSFEGEGDIYQKRTGEGGGLKTGKIVPTSFMDDSICKFSRKHPLEISSYLMLIRHQIPDCMMISYTTVFHFTDKSGIAYHHAYRTTYFLLKTSL